MNNKIKMAGLVTLTAVALAGCHVGHGATGSASARVSGVLATNTSAAYDKQQAEGVLNKCMPAKNALTQLEWFRVMIAGKHSHDYQKGETARKTFETCAGVNPANDAKFKAQVENQGATVAETYVKDEASGNKTAAKAAVKDFTENTIEKDAVADR